jgi:hypothetical protein
MEQFESASVAWVAVAAAAKRADVARLDADIKEVRKSKVAAEERLRLFLEKEGEVVVRAAAAPKGKGRAAARVPEGAAASGGGGSGGVRVRGRSASAARAVEVPRSKGRGRRARSPSEEVEEPSEDEEKKERAVVPKGRGKGRSARGPTEDEAEPEVKDSSVDDPGLAAAVALSKRADLQEQIDKVEVELEKLQERKKRWSMQMESGSFTPKEKEEAERHVSRIDTSGRKDAWRGFLGQLLSEALAALSQEDPQELSIGLIDWIVQRTARDSYEDSSFEGWVSELRNWNAIGRWLLVLWGRPEEQKHSWNRLCFKTFFYGLDKTEKPGWMHLKASKGNLDDDFFDSMVKVFKGGEVVSDGVKSKMTMVLKKKPAGKVVKRVNVQGSFQRAKEVSVPEEEEEGPKDKKKRKSESPGIPEDLEEEVAVTQKGPEGVDFQVAVAQAVQEVLRRERGEVKEVKVTTGSSEGGFPSQRQDNMCTAQGSGVVTIMRPVNGSSLRQVSESLHHHVVRM